MEIYRTSEGQNATETLYLGGNFKYVLTDGALITTYGPEQSELQGKAKIFGVESYNKQIRQFDTSRVKLVIVADRAELVSCLTHREGLNYRVEKGGVFSTAAPSEAMSPALRKLCEPANNDSN